MSVNWFIDNEGVVHASYCAAKADTATRYMAKAVDYREMAIHLKRNDQQHGHKGSPSLLKPCSLCIPDGSE